LEVKHTAEFSIIKIGLDGMNSIVAGNISLVKTNKKMCFL